MFHSQNTADKTTIQSQLVGLVPEELVNNSAFGKHGETLEIPSPLSVLLYVCFHIPRIIEH